MGGWKFLIDRRLLKGGASNAKRWCAFGFARFELKYLM
jgi:hypothetical protein